MDSSHRPPLTIAAFCLLATLGAGAAHAQIATDPCSLLTPAQIAQAAGGDYDAGQPIGTSACQWSASAPAKGLVTLTVQPGSTFAGMKAILPGSGRMPLTGVGDDAFYATFGKLTTLSVKKGDLVFIVKAYGVPGNDQQMALEKKLAEDVVAEL